MRQQTSRSSSNASHPANPGPNPKNIDRGRLYADIAQGLKEQRKTDQRAATGGDDPS
jgi:hypothetical protein